jgi:hypothetical protein
MKLLLLLSRFENRELQKGCVLCMEPIVCDLYILSFSVHSYRYYNQM